MKLQVTSWLVSIQIRKLRKKRGLSQKRLAQLASCSPVMLEHLESGHGPITIDDLGRIAQVLDVTATSIIEAAENEEA